MEAEMLPSQVRARVLRDHQELAQMLEQVEKLAAELEPTDPLQVSELRGHGRALLGRLEVHMGWEEQFLVPALRRADAWGNERAQALLDDHVEQREILHHVLAGVDDAERPPQLLRRTLLDFGQLLRKDMEDEEAAMLDPRVLRDDVIGIDVEAG